MGWSWRTFRNTKWPTFWVPVGPAGYHMYRLRCMFDVIDMPWDWPVVVNYHEACAFTAWKSEQEGIPLGSPTSLRILTELEHHRIRDQSLLDTTAGTKCDPVMHHAGGESMIKRGFNLNLSYGSETPVNFLPPSSKGFHDVMGNTWEWCEDHFSALPGFKVHPYYDDFSLPCFDGLHNIIKGGSWISTGDEASIFARFHFRPHFHQFSSFRVVRPDAENPAIFTSCMDNQGPYVGNNPFRSSNVNHVKELVEATKKEVNLALHNHFDSGHVPDFLKLTANYPTRLVDFITHETQKHGITCHRALDVGCGVGGIAFALARHFSEVVAVDLNPAIIEVAKELQRTGSVTYESAIEGDLFESRTVEAPQGVDRERVKFKQADAYCLPAEMTNYDVVVVSNLLCQIPLPNTALGRMTGPRALVRPGGLLVIASPYDWDAKVTPKDLWLGGFHKNGNAQNSISGLAELFGSAFTLVDQVELPMAIREHARRYHVSISHVSIWKANEVKASA